MAGPIGRMEQQIQQTRRALTDRQAQFEAQKKQLQAVATQAVVSRAQLQQQTLTQRAQLKQREAEFKQRKAQALVDLEKQRKEFEKTVVLPTQAQLKKTEEKIPRLKEISKTIQERQEAQALIKSGVTTQEFGAPAGTSPGVSAAVEELQAEGVLSPEEIQADAISRREILEEIQSTEGFKLLTPAGEEVTEISQTTQIETPEGVKTFEEFKVFVDRLKDERKALETDIPTGPQQKDLSSAGKSILPTALALDTILRKGPFIGALDFFGRNVPSPQELVTKIPVVQKTVDFFGDRRSPLEVVSDRIIDSPIFQSVVESKTEQIKTKAAQSKLLAAAGVGLADKSIEFIKKNPIIQAVVEPKVERVKTKVAQAKLLGAAGIGLASGATDISKRIIQSKIERGRTLISSGLVLAADAREVIQPRLDFTAGLIESKTQGSVDILRDKSIEFINKLPISSPQEFLTESPIFQSIVESKTEQIKTKAAQAKLLGAAGIGLADKSIEFIKKNPIIQTTLKSKTESVKTKVAGTKLLATGLANIPIVQSVIEADAKRIEERKNRIGLSFFSGMLPDIEEGFQLAKAGELPSLGTPETRSGFFLSTFGRGIREFGTDVAEATLFKPLPDEETFLGTSLFAAKRTPGFQFQPASETVGKEADVAGQVALITTTGAFGTALLFAPFAEKFVEGGPKATFQFAKERKLETALALTFGFGKIATSGIKFFRQPFFAKVGPGGKLVAAKGDFRTIFGIKTPFKQKPPQNVVLSGGEPTAAIKSAAQLVLSPGSEFAKAEGGIAKIFTAGPRGLPITSFKIIQGRTPATFAYQSRLSFLLGKVPKIRTKTFKDKITFTQFKIVGEPPSLKLLSGVGKTPKTFRQLKLTTLTEDIRDTPALRAFLIKRLKDTPRIASKDEVITEARIFVDPLAKLRTKSAKRLETLDVSRKKTAQSLVSTERQVGQQGPFSLFEGTTIFGPGERVGRTTTLFEQTLRVGVDPSKIPKRQFVQLQGGGTLIFGGQPLTKTGDLILDVRGLPLPPRTPPPRFTPAPAIDLTLGPINLPSTGSQNLFQGFQSGKVVSPPPRAAVGGLSTQQLVQEFIPKQFQNIPASAFVELPQILKTPTRLPFPPPPLLSPVKLPSGTAFQAPGLISDVGTTSAGLSTVVQTDTNILRTNIELETPSVTTQVPRTTQIPRLSQVPRLFQPTAQVPKLGIASATAQVPRTVQSPKQVPRLGLAQATAQVPRVPRVPRILLPLFLPSLESGGQRPRFSSAFLSKVKKAYEVQVRRDGKFKKISKRLLPKGKALQLGARRTITTLAATFRIIEKGTTREQDIEFTPSKRTFRKPKTGRTKNTFIERKPLRIKKGSGEIPEILGIRRSRARGIRLF